MVTPYKLTTPEAFDEFTALPENKDRLFELIGGKIVEVVSNNYASMIGMLIGAVLTVFVRQRDLGWVTGADGGYWIAGERYIPDVAFISKARQPSPSREAYNPNPPDLVVEVLSPTNDPDDIRIKIVNYLRAGVTVWLVNPDKQQIEVYTPDQSPKILMIGDTLDGGTLLPGFTLALKEIFAQ
jgi:Uma2 family endonuclease